MATPVRNSNTSAVKRIQRVLKHGLYNLQLANTKTTNVQAGITYYLLYNDEIVTFRQWYQLGRPRYVVAGSQDGCKGHLRRLIQQRF